MQKCHDPIFLLYNFKVNKKNAGCDTFIHFIISYLVVSYLILTKEVYMKKQIRKKVYHILNQIDDDRLEAENRQGLKIACLEEIALNNSWITKKNINVNCISPGFIKTAMTDKIDEKFKEVIISKIPSARLGEPEDVANAVIFLASSHSDYINGETLHVNGGMYMA